jgi:hypothetical protein
VKRLKAENTKSPAYRENTQRMTISLPRGLPEVLRPICRELALEYSKVFRRGLDAFVRENHDKISPELYEQYNRLRKVRD